MALNRVISYGASGLPPGLAVDPRSGLITGRPTQAGLYSVVILVSNTLGGDQRTVTLAVNLPLPGMVLDSFLAVGFGSVFNYQVIAVNDPVWFAASGLPTGLAIDPSSGVISGTPLELGDFPLSVLASNRYGVATGSATIRVSPVVAWGGSSSGQTNVPAGLSNVVAVAGGRMRSLALRADGTVVAWGDNPFVPAGLTNVVAVAGSSHSLALREDGTVVAWGFNWYGQTDVPAGLTNVVAVAAGEAYSLALLANGTVAAWGLADVPSGLSNVLAVAAGDRHSLALRADGMVVAWGNNDQGQTTVPSGLSNVLAVAAGDGHSLALVANGTVVAWGGNSVGQTNVPAGLSNVVAVAAGALHSLALRADGTVVAWGDNSYGQTMVPSALSNVGRVAGGGFHSLALLGTHPIILRHPVSLVRSVGGAATFNVTAVGAPLSYQWRFGSTTLVGATNSDYTIPNVQSSQFGDYSVVITNNYGSVTSRVAVLTALGPGKAFSLLDYYHPIYPGNQWVYDTHDPHAYTTVIRIPSVNSPLTLYLGCGNVQTYATNVVWLNYLQGDYVAGTFTRLDSSWTNFVVVENDYWGLVGSDHGIARTSYRSGPGLVFAGQMTLRQTVSKTGDFYSQGVCVGTEMMSITPVDLADVTTPYGFFPGCLHLWMTNTILSDTSVDEMWMAKGFGTVKWIHTSSHSAVPEVNELRAASFFSPPRITTQPQNLTGSLGSTVNYNVEAIGDTPFSYQWRKNGTNLVNGAKFSGVTEPNLTIANLQPDDVGNYTVVVTNAYGSVTSTAAVLTVCAQGTGWQWTDDFSSGISAANWTLYQTNTGQMTVMGTNGHASFVVPAASTDSQNAYLVLHGTPTAAEDWTVEITGHNSAAYSAQGSSQLQLAVVRTDGAGTSDQEGYRIAMARGSAGQRFNALQWITGDDITRASVIAPNVLFALRLAYHSASGMIEAWYDPDASGQGWTRLDTISLVDFSPTMTASDTFTFAVLGNAYFGPIAEGQVFVDDFSLLGAPLRFASSLSISSGLFQMQLTGPANASVMLQASSDLTNWTVIATNTLPAGGLPLPQPMSTNRQQFFRARLGP